MGGRSLLAAAALLLASLTVAQAFYFPGVPPIAWEEGARIPLLVNKLDSKESAFPHDYYYYDFCDGDGEQKHASLHENLGQVVFGERIVTAPHEIKMNVPMKCNVVCVKDYEYKNEEDRKKIDLLQQAINDEYMVHWIVDNMPVVRRVYEKGFEPMTTLGFPVGVPKKLHIYNHVSLTVFYHTNPKESGHRIVGVEVTVSSFDHKGAKAADITCDRSKLAPLKLKLEKGEKLSVAYTYDVEFKTSEVHWASRWDHYLSVADPKIHWFSIINSLIIVLFLSGMVAMIILRTLHKDIARYNAPDQEEAQEEFGWKLVHGDVFRPPKRGMLLSVFVGTGVQLAIMAIFTLVFAALGFLSPAYRGSLMTSMLVLFVCLGTPAGYISARLYKMFGGERWKTNVLMTALLVPGIVFAIFFILNIVLAAKKSSAAVPFLTMLELLALWVCISVPLCFLGAYLGFKRPTIEHPVRTNQIPRQIPDQVFYMRTVPAILMGGILPFGAIFIELFFILASVWFNQLYYVFGFLFLVFVILAITCAEVTVLMTYFHLCAEEYRWWWRAFMTSGATAFYFLAYSIFYYFTKVEMNGFSNGFMFFGYTLIMSFLFFLVTGTFGFFASFLFVRKIFASVKVD